MNLCYADEKFLWFSDKPVGQVWGDDWNDAPYEHNAGVPYEEFGPFIKIALDCEYELPCHGEVNSRWSVEQINAGAIAWIRLRFWDGRNDILFPAGIELDQVLERCKENGVDVYVKG